MSAYSLHAPIMALMQKRMLAKLPTVEAIRQHINLLLGTRLRECRYDLDMGCTVWDQDYANITNPTSWKSEAEQSITELIQRYEKRLQYTRVYVEVDEPIEQDADGRFIRVRRRITVRVGGTLPETGEVFPDQEFIMYFSPVATE